MLQRKVVYKSTYAVLLCQSTKRLTLLISYICIRNLSPMNATKNVTIHAVTQCEWKWRLKIVLTVYFQFTFLQYELKYNVN